MINHFLLYISDERRFSAHTVKAYQSDLSSFSNFLNSTFEISDLSLVSPEMIRSWVVSLMDNKISPRSVNRKVSSLKSFYRFLLKKGIVGKDPSTSISTLKVPQRLPSYIEKGQINEYLNSEQKESDFVQARNKLVIDLLYSSGLRRSELVGLKVSSIDFGMQRMKVLGKRNKERIIPLSEKMLSVIKNYLVLKETTFNEQSPYLIITNKGNQPYPEFIYRIVTKELAGITESKKSPHVLRHTFATHMLNNGANINVIKELLGHANLSATQIYTHNTIEQLKSIYTNAHPRAKLKKGG
jgi:integrase/recombinase XerC